MTTLTLNPVQSEATSTQSQAPRTAPSVGQSAVETVTDPTADTVSISAAAQPGAGSSQKHVDLSDEQAAETSLVLRQQLGSQALSTTARQNQAIVSLLR